jgi:Tfp pilus assembly protein PilO
VKQRKPLPRAAIFGLIAFGAVLFALVGYMLLIKPQKSHLADLNKQIADTQAQIDLYRSQAAAAKPNVAPKVRVADIYRLARAMPSSMDTADILIELNSVAQSAGVEIDSISPGQATPGNGFEIVPLAIAFHGDFYAMTDFLYRLRTLVNVRHGQLEAGGRIFAIDSVSLSPDSGSGRSLNVQLNLDTFVYGAAATASGAAPPPATTAATTTSTDTTATTTTTSASAEGAP